MLLEQGIEVVVLPKCDHDISFLTANLLLYLISHVYFIVVLDGGGALYGCVCTLENLLTHILKNIVSIDQSEWISPLIVGILLKKVVVYIFNVIVRIRVLQVLIQLELNDPNHSIPTLLLKIQFKRLGRHVAPVGTDRPQRSLRKLLLDLLLGEAEVVDLTQAVNLHSHQSKN